MNAENHTLWAVNINGPDDIFAVPCREAAIHNANRFNAWWEETFRAKRLDDPNELTPVMWAVPVEWPYGAESHASNLADPSNEYRDWRSVTATGGN